MSASVTGMYGWHLEVDEDGYRDYTADWKVLTTSPLDGPQTVMNASGLPVIGAVWDFGNDSDPWCFCRPNMAYASVTVGEPDVTWKVRQTFSNRPLKRCQDVSIENPLMEPFRISGAFGTYSFEASQDKDGRSIKTTSHEIIRGSIVEKDGSKPTVSIGFNTTSLPLTLFASTMHKVNDATLWGLNARCVRLVGVNWEKLMYGVCTSYYSIDYDFAIDYNTFDRKAIDEGTKILAPGGTASDPRDWMLYKNPNDDEKDTVIYDATGQPWDGTPGDENYIDVKLYQQTNLLTLGIPSSL